MGWWLEHCAGKSERNPFKFHVGKGGLELSTPGRVGVTNHSLLALNMERFSLLVLAPPTVFLNYS